MMHKLLDSVQGNWPNCCSLYLCEVNISDQRITSGLKRH